MQAKLLTKVLHSAGQPGGLGGQGRVASKSWSTAFPPTLLEHPCPGQ